VIWSEIAIVGGGCYGTFYARQLSRAKAAGKAQYRRLLVVDRDPGCRMARELGEAEDRRLVTQDWDGFFDDFLAPPASTDRRDDAIVPSPLMPHLMYAWLLRRAEARWPTRLLESRPIPMPAGTPYDTAAPDGTGYVSFADWICPTHCIEPATCPVTRAPRTWEMGDALGGLARRLGAAGPVLFTCRHQTFGVGMLSVAEVLAGDAQVEEAGRSGGPADLLVGTVSSCHGAVNLLHLGALQAPATGGPAYI
jgi:hypothetical protein